MRSKAIINEICLILDLPVNEQLIGKKWYFASAERLEDMAPTLLTSSDRTSKRFPAETSCYLAVFPESFYTHYKKNLAVSASAVPARQYIYSFDRPLNIFFPDEYHIKKLFDVGALLPDAVKRFYGWENKDISDDSLPKRVANIIKFGQWKSDSPLRAVGKHWEKARNLYDGFRSFSSERTYIYLDVLLKHAKLIDGNAVRFPSRGSVINELPFPKEKYDEWEKLIVPSLAAYTSKFGYKLESDVKDWLRKNYEKPYKEITLYRGFRFKLDRTTALGENIKFYLSRLKKFAGMTAFTNCQVGKEIAFTRDKESSWSTSPLVSTALYSSMREGSINLLVKATIPSEKILIDFTLLPMSEKKKFSHWGQNEVIVDNYAIPAIINKIWVDEAFNQWLLDHGFKFIAQKGIVKIN